MKIFATTRGYETFEDYVNSGKFNDKQLKQIFWGFSKGLSPKSISLYADPVFNHAQMECIYMTLVQGAPRRLVTFMADPRFDVYQMHELRSCIEDNPPIEALDLVADPKFSAGQMHEIVGAMYQDKVTLDNIRVFAKPEFTPGQMSEARRAVENYAISDADFQKYTRPEYRPKMLRVIYQAVESGKFSEDSIDQFIQICLAHDMDNFDDTKLGYMLSAFEYGLDVSDVEHLFFDQSFSRRQLYEILIGLPAGLTRDEVMSYADPKLDEYKMEAKRKALLQRK